MSGKIISLIIVLLMIFVSFGVGGNYIENAEDGNNSYNTEDLPWGLGLLDEEDHDTSQDIIFTGDAPSDFDWRNKDGEDWTTPIKNQSECGSCWAFATIGVVESAINIKNNDSDLDLDLSEQYMVSCCDYFAYGCGGALTVPVGLNYIDWVKFYDAIPESKFPYSASNEDCSNKDSDFYKYKVEVTDWGWVDGGTNSVKNALVQRGPLLATMTVWSDFYNDYPDPDKWEDDVYYYRYGLPLGGHAVIIVGYSEDYWICKNSWGTDWGLDGWFKIKFNQVKIQDNVAFIKCDKYVDPDDAVISFELYKIGCNDDIEGWPDPSGADWRWEVSVDGLPRTDDWADLESTYASAGPIQTYRWIIDKEIFEITFKLKDYDVLGSDDLADVGEGHENEPYDNSGDIPFSQFPQEICFKATIDRNKPTLKQALSGHQILNAIIGDWSGYMFSGDFDGSEGDPPDENDADIFFNLDYGYIAPPKIPILRVEYYPLTWISVPAGGTYTGAFRIKNVGDPDSELDWEIESYPDWGTWSFDPPSGDNLTPEDGVVFVKVSVVAPNESFKQFAGNIKVVNKDNPNDFASIPCLMQTPRNRLFTNNFFLKMLDNFPILKNIIFNMFLKNI